jgi:hypothetical protein
MTKDMQGGAKIIINETIHVAIATTTEAEAGGIHTLQGDPVIH